MSFSRTELLKFFLGAFLTLNFVSKSYAIGGAFISDEVPSARAAGAGYVGVAGQNNDPTAVYTNPAAMTALQGTQLTLGAHWENIHGSYQDNSGNQTKERVTNVGVPNMSVTQSFFDGMLGAGLSVQSPYGLETYWDSNSPMRYVATDSRINLIDVTPAIAYKVNPMVSVGAGVDYFNLFNATLNRQVNVTAVNYSLANQGFGTFTGPSSDASSSLSGQGTDWGYHAGLTFQPAEQHAFGITYHSKEVIRVLGSLQLSGLSGTMAGIFGASNYSTSVYTDLVLPQNIQLGYAFKPTKQWTIETDAAWYDWAQGRDLNFRYSETDPTRLALLTTNGQGNPVSLTSRDAWSFNVGANYKLSDRWQVRSGFWYEPSALPETTFSPAYMDLSRYGLSVGGGYSITENLTVDAAYTAVFFHNRTINNNVQQSATGIPDGTGGAGINGTYSDFANLLALNFTYRFGGTH
jgi:long-chain fatty acid transport protein